MTILCCCLWTISLFGQSNHSAKFWQEVTEKSFADKNAERQIIPQKYRTALINWEVMTPVLESAPLRFSAEAETQEVLIRLPMPDGSTEQFKIVEAPGHSRDQWEILRALSEECGVSLPYNSIEELRARIYNVAPHLIKYDQIEPTVYGKVSNKVWGDS